MKYTALVCAALVGCGGPLLAAEAEPVRYGLRAGVDYSDNVEHLPSGSERSGTSAMVGLQLRGERPTGRLRYDLMADVAYADYVHPNLSPDLLGHAALGGSYDFVPDNFAWNAGLNFDQIRQNLARPDAPGNRERQLMLSTGPTFRARFSGNMGVQLDGHYTHLSYSRRPFDNETLGGRLLLGRLTSPRAQLALGASYDDVSYISASVPPGLDYRRREVFGRLALHGVRTDLALEAGYSDIAGKIADESSPILRARLSRKVSPFVSAFVQAVREYPTSDISAPTNQQVAGGSGYDTTPLSAGPRLNVSAAAGFAYDRTRTRADISYSRHKEDARQSGSGIRHYNQLRAELSRAFTPRIQGSLYGSMTDEDLNGVLQSGKKAKEDFIGTALGIGLGRALSVDLRVEHRRRDGAASTDDYSEFSGGIYLRYGGTLGSLAPRQ